MIALEGSSRQAAEALGEAEMLLIIVERNLEAAEVELVLLIGIFLKAPACMPVIGLHSLGSVIEPGPQKQSMSNCMRSCPYLSLFRPVWSSTGFDAHSFEGLD